MIGTSSTTEDEGEALSKDQLEAILQGVTEGITVQGVGGSRLIYANKAAAHLVGFDSVAALLATPLSQIMQHFELMDEAGRPMPLADLPGRQAMLGEKPKEVLVRFRHKETGEERWSLVNARPVLNDLGRVEFVVNIFRNVTERMRLYEAERLALAQAEKAQHRLALLAEASAMLATSLDYATTLKRVAELAVPRLADLCAIDLADETGQMRRVAVVHQDPAKAQLALELAERYPIRLDMSSAAGIVLLTGRPLLFSTVTETNLAAWARGLEHMQLLKAVNLQSAMIVPLKARDRVFGAVNFLSSDSGRHFDEEDLRLAAELAEQMALAVDNARLFQEARQLNEELEQRVAQRTQALEVAKSQLEAEIQVADTLGMINLALGKTLDLDMILATLLDELGRLVPYDSAAVFLLAEEQTLTVYTLRGHERWVDANLAKDMHFAADTTPNLRIVLQEQRSLLIEDTLLYPGWIRRPGAEYIRSWLGVPLLIGQQAVGVFALDKAEPAYFSEAHQRLVEVLATQVSIALQNARLYEEVKAGREQLRQLSRQVLSALEDERRWVSRELHDEAGQALTALKIGLALVRSDLADVSAQTQLREFEEQVGETLEQIRRLAQALRPPALEAMGLTATLEAFCSDFSARTQLPVHYEGVNVPAVPEEMILSFYRFLQEALTNVLKHAEASQVVVRWGYDGQAISLAVTDDGRGFRVEALPAAPRKLHGLGLLGMQERFELLGGRVRVESQPGKGTCLTAVVPWRH